MLKVQTYFTYNIKWRLCINVNHHQNMGDY